MSDYIQVITTIDTRERAEAIARHLVAERVAACAQVSGPITSTYRWNDEIATDEEWYCIAKSTGETFTRLESAIRSVHTYDEPEIIAVPIAAGSNGYLAWVTASVSSAP